MARLDVLGNQLPGDLQRRQEQTRRTQDILTQNRIQQSGTPTPNAGQLAAQAVGQRGMGRVQQRAQQGNQVTQVAQAQLQQRGIESRRKIAAIQRGLQEQSRRSSQRLFNLDQGIRDRLLTDQLTFKRDELGRQQFNERQLADYALANAQTEQDYQRYAQQVQQATQRKQQYMQAAYAKIKQELEQSYQKEDSKETRALRKELAQAEHAMKIKIQREQVKAANRAGMLGAAGSIVGGVAGAFIGGPAIAAAGASIGNGLFTAFGS